MRNSILFMLLTLFSTTYSQINDSIVKNLSTTKKKPSFSDSFSMGFKISPTISWLDVNHNDLQTDGATITGGLGFVAEYEINTIISVVSGLNISLPGGYVFDNASMSDANTKNNFRINFTSLDMPFLMRVNLTNDNKNVFFVQGGAYIDYSFSATEFHKASRYSLPDIKTSITPLINPIQFYYSFGFGTKHKF